jgi:hypothetical protein
MKHEERSPPKVWNQEYLGRLLGAARGMKGSFHTVRKADFWTAWVLVAYQTGARPGEMFAIECEQVTSNGGLQGSVLSDEAKAAVQKLIGTRKHLFGRLAPRREILREFSAMQKKAKLRQQ